MLKVLMKLESGAMHPFRASEGASGYDLFARTNPIQIEPGTIALVPTGVSLAIPLGYEGQVRSRSGLASKGIMVLNSPGTIDSDYRGEISVILANFSAEPFQVMPHMRIAQLVFARVEGNILFTEHRFSRSPNRQFSVTPPAGATPTRSAAGGCRAS